MDRADKERRKQILNDLREKAREEFENSLPMDKNIFVGLFDHLDSKLGEKECEDDHTMTRVYLNTIGIENIEDVLGWLVVKGGYCDCEILANVEEQFE